MDDAKYPMTGTCRCGKVRIEINDRPIVTSACHCRGCQRMSAGAYSLTAIFPAQVFSVAAGEPVKGGAGTPGIDHFFCPDCKTWMFTRNAGMEAFVNVRPSLFDDLRWTRPFIETMAAEKLPWVETPARHSYQAFPSPEDFQRLMDEFAASA